MRGIILERKGPGYYFQKTQKNYLKMICVPVNAVIYSHIKDVHKCQYILIC